MVQEISHPQPSVAARPPRAELLSLVAAAIFFPLLFLRTLKPHYTTLSL